MVDQPVGAHIANTEGNHIVSSFQIEPGTLDALSALCRRFAVTELALFGSAARGELTPDSDVDLLVSFAEGVTVTFSTLARFGREAEAVLGRPVDVVPRSGLKASIRDEVLASAKVLYAA